MDVYVSPSVYTGIPVGGGDMDIKIGELVANLILLINWSSQNLCNENCRYSSVQICTFKDDSVQICIYVSNPVTNLYRLKSASSPVLVRVTAILGREKCPI